MIGAVLFDLDGTLIEFNVDYELAKKIVITKLLEMGVDRKILSESNPTVLNVENAVSFMQSKGMSKTELKILRSEVYRAVEPLELEAAEKPVLRENVIELLSSLRKMNIKMAVCTNNCAKATDLIIQKLSLREFLEDVVTRDDVERLKPFPDLLVKACERLRIPASKAVHVGDSPVDIMAAINAGVKPIGIVSGMYRAEKLRDVGAEKVALNVKELEEILLKLV